MKIGTLTIGQSPRNDLIPEIEAFFKGAEIIQLGALDGLSKEQIADLAPSGDDEILVSKLKDDSWALMAESKIISLLLGLLGVRADDTQLPAAGKYGYYAV